MTSYAYTNLTSAIKDKASPLRQYLDQRYPNTRLLQAEYRARSGPLLVHSGDAYPGTLGAAFDLQVRFLLDPEYVPVIALQAFLGTGLEPAILGVIAAAQKAVQCGSGEELSRSCWALALTTEVYRIGGVLPGSPINPLLEENRFRDDELLALAPADALRQMDELCSLVRANLMPHLAAPFALGPSFEGSEHCSADADLIAGGMLLDIKTRLGAKNQRTGERPDSLPLTDIHQILGYALFDRPDRYGIDTIGIYSARYGTLITWKLAETLDRLAGELIDLAGEREVVWRLLGGR